MSRRRRWKVEGGAWRVDAVGRRAGRWAWGPGPCSRPTLRPAFTLMELLVVVTVIAILAGMVLGGLNAARETARVAKTRATIAKIDKIIMAKYESYRSRRLPLGSAELEAMAGQYRSLGETPMRALARARMNATRDLMRMEMPDRWNDVVEADGSVRAPLRLPAVPALAQRYWSAFNASRADRKTKERWGPAECLYQIVMATPGAAGQFQESEIGDSDGDGLKEFRDAWGNPILYLRWPAGFTPGYRADTDLQTGDAPDPFDPLRILGPQQSYALYPLIYSAGPNGLYDVNIGKPEPNGGNHSDDPYFRYNLNATYDLNPYVPFASGNSAPMIGTPIDEDPVNGSNDWLDNIHNHHLDLR